jgi:hypothetical protein
MAYDKKKIFEQAKEAITKHKLFFIEDIVAFLPIAKKTFYEYFPIDSNESNELKEMLETNRIEIKSSMRSKWYKSNNATLQMALMKLICTDDERKKLSMNHTDITTNGKDVTTPYKDWTDEQLKSALERLRTK